MSLALSYLHRPYLKHFSEDVPYNFLTFYRNHLFATADNHNVRPSDIELMLFVFPLEFFAYEWLHENFRCTKNYIWRALPNLRREGYIEVIANKGMKYTVSGEDRVLKSNRYKLTTKGRKLVREFYRSLETGYNADVPDVEIRYFHDEKRF